MSSAHAPPAGPRAASARALGAGARDRADEDLLLGRTLAQKYLIESPIGEGAMGRVYRARQVALDKPIAVKVLHRHLTGDPRIEKRFHREARAAARLSHPNSLHILDFGSTDEGTLYIAMELLDGEDLQTVLDHDFPLSPARIADILVPVLRAVEEAHRAGIIHRDLKPENVVVLSDRSGREHVKVCDFGIAKILDGEDRAPITVDGFVCGTPQYMAPEQARGDAIDHRCDIYAAGVVLYRMLCGEVPFTGDSPLRIITRHLGEAPLPPSARRPDLGIPRPLEEICLRAMQKDPAARFQTASEMADALEEVVRALGSDAQHRLGEGPFRGPAREEASGAAAGTMAPDAPPPMPVLSRARRAALPAMVAVVILGAAWLWRASGPTSPPADLATPAAHGNRVVAAERSASPAQAAARLAASAEPAAASPADPTPRAGSPGEAAFEEGRRRYLANDVAGAIERFEEAARLMPHSPDVQKQLGRAYMRAGDTERSVRAYRRYLELAPDAADRAVVERIIARH